MSGMRYLPVSSQSSIFSISDDEKLLAIIGGGLYSAQ